MVSSALPLLAVPLQSYQEYVCKNKYVLISTYWDFSLSKGENEDVPDAMLIEVTVSVW